jgi:ABC-2 type transport system ATP-binding protein
MKEGFISILDMSSIHGPNAIEASHLRRLYRKRRRPFGRPDTIVAVEDVSFVVRRGMSFGMLGPNGAGKTTTIKILSTLLLPTSGSAWVGGCDVVRDDRAVRRLLGVVLGGDRGLYAKLSARDNLIYFGHLYGRPGPSIRMAVGEKLKLVGLEDRADERVEGYSRGMKQRLHLAKALLHDPLILILDEPTIGLDPAAAVELRSAIAGLAPKHTVLLTTHDMAEAEALCEEIAIVDKGLIVAQGSPDQLKARVATTRRIVVTVARLNGHAREIESNLRSIGSVTSVRRSMSENGEAERTLMCDETTHALDHTLAIMRAEQGEVRAVRVFEPSLEDAFLAIAGRSFE